MKNLDQIIDELQDLVHDLRLANGWKKRGHSWVRWSELEGQPLDKCPGCGGPADNGNDRCVPPAPYYCTKCHEKQTWLDHGENYTDGVDE